MKATAALSRKADWQEALAEALAQLGGPPTEEGPPDLVFLFASVAYADAFPALAARAWEALGPRLLIGCSGQGIIGTAQEVEGEPALSLLAFRLPGALLTALHLRQEEMEGLEGPEAWHHRTGVAPSGAKAWLLFADPFTLDPDGLVTGLSGAYPGIPLLGGLASGHPLARTTYLFLNGDVHEEGAVALALGGPYALRPLVAQGATPIGEPWIITGAHRNLIESIAQRPAYELLVDTLRALPPELQERARSNLLVGLAVDERREEFRRGDFLIRNLLGGDPERGLLAVSAFPQVGQTIQFQLRDAAAADEELHALLGETKAALAQQPLGAILCVCNGRGIGLFGAPDHDARALARHLGPLPTAGFFCNGEIGPVGRQNFVHGFTASIALFVEESP